MTRGVTILLIIVGLFLWLAVPAHWGGVDFNVNTAGAILALVAAGVFVVDLIASR